MSNFYVDCLTSFIFCFLSNMWAQLEVKKLYVEHVIIPVNQERQTKQNFNLKTLITVCTNRFVSYSKICLIHTILRVYMFIYNDYNYYFNLFIVIQVRETKPSSLAFIDIV